MADVGSLIGFGGLQTLLVVAFGFIVRGQNQKIEKKQGSALCDERHGGLDKKMDKVVEVVERLESTQSKMITQIALLNNGRKRVTDE